MLQGCDYSRIYQSTGQPHYTQVLSCTPFCSCCHTHQQIHGVQDSLRSSSSAGLQVCAALTDLCKWSITTQISFYLKLMVFIKSLLFFLGTIFLAKYLWCLLWKWIYQEPYSHNVIFKTEFNNHTLNYTNTALNLTVCLIKSLIKKPELHLKDYILCFCIIAQKLYYLGISVTTAVVF